LGYNLGKISVEYKILRDDMIIPLLNIFLKARLNAKSLKLRSLLKNPRPIALLILNDARSNDARGLESINGVEHLLLLPTTKLQILTH